MSSKNTISAIALCLLFIAACSKKESGSATTTTRSTTTTGSTSGSPYTHLMTGSRSFRLIESGYNPVKSATVTDTSFTTVNITMLDSGTVIFANDTFRYDSTGTSGILYFGYTTPVPSANPGSGHLQFDHTANTIQASIVQHISAGAGDWTYVYSSM